MPVGADSLLNMARRATGRYSAGITDIGDIPYELIKPALLKIESPEKLYQLEQQSPQIIGHDAEVWINFLRRDIPNWETKPHQPANPRNWYKVYKKLKKEAEEHMNKGEDSLKAALADIRKAKETKQILSTPSQDRVRRSYGQLAGKRNWKPSNKSLTVMERLKKDSRAVDRHATPSRAPTVIKQPPHHFLEAARRQAHSAQPAKPVVRSPPKNVSRPPLHTPASKPKAPAVEEEYDIMRDREARLQAMKSKKVAESSEKRVEAERPNGASSRPSPPNVAEPVGLSSRYLEDLFDDEEPPNQTTLANSPAERPRSASPGRMASPRPVKRKAPDPSLFMAKKPMLKRLA